MKPHPKLLHPADLLTQQKPALAASAKVPPAATTSAALPALKAVLAVHRTIASGLEWNRGLLSAPGADHGRALRCAAVVSAARLFVFLGLAARFTPLGRRISAFPEELLILSRKREGLPAIATHELLIFSHISLSMMLQVFPALDFFGRS
jgi:hypothetical protein